MFYDAYHTYVTLQESYKHCYGNYTWIASEHRNSLDLEILIGPSPPEMEE